jgi:hypothetical protein
MPSYKATFISRVNTAKLFASGEQKLLRSRLTASSEFSPKFRHQLRALLVLKSNAPKSSRATVEGAYLLLYFFYFHLRSSVANTLRPHVTTPHPHPLSLLLALSPSITIKRHGSH